MIESILMSDNWCTFVPILVTSSFAQYNMDQFTPAKLEGYDEPVCFLLGIILFIFLKENVSD